MTDWRARWEKTSAELAASRAECLRLREALDELNAQTEGLFNAASRSDHVRAMVHTIRMQWARIRELKNEMRERDMTERIDHAAEAISLRRMSGTSGLTEEGCANVLAAAHVHATLALVEQQRIANLIALNDRFTGEIGDALMSAKRENGYLVGQELNPEIAAALGIETKETNE